MDHKRCAACRGPMQDGEPHYARLCKICFVSAKKAEHNDLVEEVESLRAEVARLRTAPAPIKVDPQVLRWLLQRSHPDQNSGSEIATQATRWLLSLREVARV